MENTRRQLILCSARLALYLTLHLAAIGLFFWTTYSWYETQKSALAQLISIPGTLGEDRLIGGLFTSLGIGQLHLSDWYALGISALLFCTIFYFTSSVGEAVELRSYRRAMLLAKKTESLALLNEQITINLIYSSFLGSILAYLIYWDIGILTVTANQQALIAECGRFAMVLLGALLLRHTPCAIERNFCAITELVRGHRDKAI